MKGKTKQAQRPKISIKNILVPIDGSEHSKKALEYALDLAEKYSGKINLLTVVQPVVVTSPVILTQPMISQSPAPFYVKEIEESHKSILKESFRWAKEKNPEIEISKKIITGRATESIVEEAKKEKIDLIVIGSHGTSGIKEWFLGSVTNRVADQAPCPVFIVK